MFNLLKKKMEKIFEIKSPFKIIIKLDNNGLEIQRKGLLVASGQKGEKKLFYKNISAVHLKDAGTFSNGFLQFTLHGSPERSGVFGTIGLVSDENTLIFSKNENIIMHELKTLIEEKIVEASASATSHTTVVSEKSVAEQIKEFKELFDLGIISEEEFIQKKKQLLNL